MLRYWFYTFLLRYAPLGRHRERGQGLFGRVCPRCVVAVLKATVYCGLLGLNRATGITHPINVTAREDRGIEHMF